MDLFIWISDWLFKEELAASSIVGVIFIIASIYQKYDDFDNQKFPKELRFFGLKDLVSSRRYLQGLFAYCTLMVAFYLLLLKVGGNVLIPIIGIDIPGTVTPLSQDNWFAIYLALFVGGIVPNFVGINNVEILFRRFGQWVTGIPSDHSFVVDKLNVAKVSDQRISEIEKYLSFNFSRKYSVIEKIIDQSYINKWIKSRAILVGIKDSYEDSDIQHITVRADRIFKKLIEEALSLQDEIDRYIKLFIDEEESNKTELMISSPTNDNAKHLRKKITYNFELLTYILSSSIVVVESSRKTSVDKILSEFRFENLEIREPDLNGRIVESVIESMGVIFLVTLIFVISNNIMFGNESINANPLILLTIPLGFGLSLSVTLLVYLYRRRNLILRGNKEWYQQSDPYSPIPAKRIFAFALSFAGLLVVAISIDAVGTIIEADSKNIKSMFKFDTKYAVNILSLSIIPLILTYIFTFWIEEDKRILEKLSIRQQIDVKKKLALQIFVISFCCGVLSVALDAALSIDVGNAVRSLFLKDFFFSSENFRFSEILLRIFWKFSIVFLGVGAFFVSFSLRLRRVGTLNAMKISKYRRQTA